MIRTDIESLAAMTVEELTRHEADLRFRSVNHANRTHAKRMREAAADIRVELRWRNTIRVGSTRVAELEG